MKTMESQLMIINGLEQYSLLNSGVEHFQKSQFQEVSSKKSKCLIFQKKMEHNDMYEARPLGWLAL